MTIVRKLSLVVLAVGTISAQAQITRSGSVATCKLGQGCTEEVIDGQHYHVLHTKLFTIKVALERDHKYNRADVILENRSGREVHLAPSDFRIEVAGARDKRLAYVDPANLRLPKPKAPKAAPASADARPVAPSHLVAGILAAEDKIKGRVFFEGSAKSSEVALILPISGSVFEFPYSVQ